MSTQPLPQDDHWTPERYLAFERASAQKHELVHGRLRLMSGASREHNLIAVNAAAVLHSQLREGPCEVYAGDMRVKVPADGRYTYPGLVVVCGDPEFEDGLLDTLLNPSVVIEILSESTAAYDRGDNFAGYRSIPSLREYVLLAQRSPKVECFTRLPDGAWRFNPIEGLAAELVLATAGLRLPLREIYEKVRFPADSAD